MHRKSAEDKQSVREDCAATFGDSPKNLSDVTCIKRSNPLALKDLI